MEPQKPTQPGFNSENSLPAGPGVYGFQQPQSSQFSSGPTMPQSPSQPEPSLQTSPQLNTVPRASFSPETGLPQPQPDIGTMQGQGVILNQAQVPESGESKSFLGAFLLAMLLGVFGADRFYLGKVGTGILKFLTFGGLGIWALIDLILIFSNHMRAKDGSKLQGYEKNRKTALAILIVWIIVSATSGVYSALALKKAAHDLSNLKGVSISCTGNTCTTSTTEQKVATVPQPKTQKPSFDSVASTFINAIKGKDKAKADSLQSSAMKEFGQKNAGSSSFYDACRQAGDFCLPLFSNEFISKANKTTKNYTASNGKKGKELTYTLKQSLSGNSAGGPGCSSDSTSTLIIDVIPSGGSWLIDNVTPKINFSANLCPSH